MDPRNRMLDDEKLWLPRASGDGPEYRAAADALAEAAPRERGWTNTVALANAGTIGCPARAGMDPRWCCRVRRGCDRSRTAART